MKSYKRLNKKIKNKKNKSKTRRRRYKGGSPKCPRTACGSYNVNCDSDNGTCYCLDCGATTPSQYFVGPPKDYGEWIQSGEAIKWVRKHGYSNVIFSK